MFICQYYASDMARGGGRREGWGSAEATEMVLNNLFYITAKVAIFIIQTMFKLTLVNIELGQ